MEAPLYMAGIRLSGRRAVVVGGGPIALEKTEKLLACGARITLVAPTVVSELRTLADEGSIDWLEREYRTGDLQGAFIVVASTDDADINVRVFRDGDARNMLVNVVDVPELCTFQVPAITRHGSIAIAISTAGASPALAKRMKREIAEMFGEPYARLAEMLNEQRAWAKATLPTYEDRRDFFESIVNGHPDPVELLRAGDEDKVRALIEDAKSNRA
ncbi:MAG: bifunctional precorrin-2 dehydrogenase/sirohydrochlorin ferrochelatase [Actinomycetota bacterium]